MKITQIETIRVAEHPMIIWVQVHTDEGIVGLGDDADNSTYIFTEPHVGYRMPRGEGREPGTA